MQEDLLYFLGIDPGLNGAFAFFNQQYPPTNSQFLHIIDMPTLVETRAKARGRGIPPKKREIDIPALHSALDCFLPRHTIAIVEEVHSMPGQGVVSTFTFGKGFGIILGVLAALEVPIKFVRPAVWKASLNLSSDKSTSIARAVYQFPKYAHYFGRKKDDGRAEAALLAWWGMKHFGGTHDQ